jgi:hypothetical protein
MLDLIGRIQAHAAPNSILIVETDEQFQFDLVRDAGERSETSPWDVRLYAPALVGVWRK